MIRQFWILLCLPLLATADIEIQSDTESADSQTASTLPNQTSVEQVTNLIKPKSVVTIKAQKEKLVEAELQQDNPQETLPDIVTMVDRFLGPDIKRILSNPIRVESFRLAPEPDNSIPLEQKLGGFPITKLGNALNKQQIATFQRWAFDERSYIFEADKKCVFRPEMGLRFIQGDQEVEVILALHCPLWRFVYQGEARTQDCDPIEKQLKQFRNELSLGKEEGNNDKNLSPKTVSPNHLESQHLF